MALVEATGHIELALRYKTATLSWQWQADWIDENLVSRSDSLETLCFPGLDTTPSSLGVRNIRPAASKWDFLGVGAGQPVWIFSDSSYTSAGFASTQSELTGNVNISLDSVIGPAGGVFSMYTGPTPTIYMQTINGISTTDVFPKPMAHTHVNWAFSQKGLWIVKLKAQGTLSSSGAATTTSATVPLVFAVGDYARWKAARFSLNELSNSSISGDDADPDQDGWNNLMEYALGGNCRVTSALRESDGQPLAPILLPPTTPDAPWGFSFFRRKAASGFEYTCAVEASSSLAAQTWSTETGSQQIITSNTNWERVSIPVSPPQANGMARFFRLKLSPIP